MAKISTNDEIAEVYLKSQHALFQLALTYVDTLYLAEELVGDAIVAILDKSPTFESEASCVCYLKQIVRNKAISLLRKKYKIEPQKDEDIEKQFIIVLVLFYPNINPAKVKPRAITRASSIDSIKRISPVIVSTENISLRELVKAIPGIRSIMFPMLIRSA